MQSSNQNVTTNKPTPSFIQAGCPSCRPTNSVKALKGKFRNILRGYKICCLYEETFTVKLPNHGVRRCSGGASLLCLVYMLEPIDVEFSDRQILTRISNAKSRFLYTGFFGSLSQISAHPQISNLFGSCLKSQISKFHNLIKNKFSIILNTECEFKKN